MTDARSRCCDERLLSGFLDEELTQGAEQRVRLHLEDCPPCRVKLEDLRALREVMMTTRLSAPPDEGWDERPRGPASRFSRLGGWWIVLVWVAAVGGMALVQAWRDAAGGLERLVIFGGLAGVALLLISVLLDRLHAARHDRYREVEK